MENEKYSLGFLTINEEEKLLKLLESEKINFDFDHLDSKRVLVLESKTIKEGSKIKSLLKESYGAQEIQEPYGMSEDNYNEYNDIVRDELENSDDLNFLDEDLNSGEESDEEIDSYIDGMLEESEEDEILEESASYNRDDVFERYDDTDANGPSSEMSIDELIQEFKERITDSIKQIGADYIERDENYLKKEIQRLWIRKIREW